MTCGQFEIPVVVTGPYLPGAFCVFCHDHNSGGAIIVCVQRQGCTNQPQDLAEDTAQKGHAGSDNLPAIHNGVAPSDMVAEALAYGRGERVPFLCGQEPAETKILQCRCVAGGNWFQCCSLYLHNSLRLNQ